MEGALQSKEELRRVHQLQRADWIWSSTQRNCQGKRETKQLPLNADGLFLNIRDNSVRWETVFSPCF